MSAGWWVAILVVAVVAVSAGPVLYENHRDARRGVPGRHRDQRYICDRLGQKIRERWEYERAKQRWYNR